MSLNAGARLMRVPHKSMNCQVFTIPIVSLRLCQSQNQIPSPMRIHRTNNVLSQAKFRASSSSSSATQQKPSADSATPENTTHPSDPSPNLPEPLSDPLNPPASTRPPPLELPTRDPSANLFSHLFKLGKAYTTFYKTGLKAVFTNRRLARDLPFTPPPHLPPPSPQPSASTALSPPANKSANLTRSALLLRARVRHDIRRLPLFGLVVLVCGEFTPLIVLLFPRLTPYTCRIPAQTSVIRRGVEARRAASFRALAHSSSSSSSAAVADGHICRSLGLGSKMWDKMGFDVPFARPRAAGAVARIVQDDALLRSYGGGAGGAVAALVDDEVVLACEKRGINTLGKDVAVLRKELEDWVAKSAPGSTGDVDALLKEATDKVRELLLRLDGPVQS
ncbi:hypothetical protein F5Y03DRAFT_56179 [Xylaria venustula]|nr:hypothetical protein F5Y03DRAFT_56179 [Xylaria venustula]